MELETLMDKYPRINIITRSKTFSQMFFAIWNWIYGAKPLTSNALRYTLKLFHNTRIFDLGQQGYKNTKKASSASSCWYRREKMLLKNSWSHQPYFTTASRKKNTRFPPYKKIKKPPRAVWGNLKLWVSFNSC